MADKQATYEIRADVKGRESITGLADDLDEVTKVLSSELAPQAQAAASRLRELAQQDAAINAFERLKSQARDAGRALKTAETEAANYGKQISALGPPTAQEAAALQRLQSAAEGARATFTQQQAALAGAQAELQRYGIAGQNAQAAQQRLRQEVAQVRESVQGLAPAYQGAAAGAQTAGGAMTRTHRQIGDGVESISQQLARLQSFYAGLAGIQGLKSMGADLAATADEVNNLQARIKLVTGEGDNFKQSWQGVTEVALRTHSALEETGVLFTRLAQAGKDAGLSTAAASAQSLALTETINQAIQLSGAGAQASSAAITQLVQGLQGGALRGDEFNSVMEQSPRLAKALADGLGVTTGELRKMAEAGALTSDTVIKALKGQSDTVASEFNKLPPTVGRALQDLSTQWTLYVGESDKATGASAAAATAINALASNLQTIAGLLIDAGQAALAFTALRLAQHFLGIGAAAQSAAVAVAANNAQMVASGAAATTAAAGASRLATIFASLRTFTLIGIAANFKDIGTWIGESAAKLAGYKDRTEELARAEKLQADIAKEAAADRARLAALIQTAIDKQFELSKAASAGVAEFEKLTKEGASSAEAIKKVSESFDLSKVQGIKDFSAVLDKLTADGKVSATEFENAWAQALSGKDLAQFEVMARAAFSGAAREGERVAQMMDAVLRESVKRTGLEFEVMQGRIGVASRSAINDLEVIIGGLNRLKEQGVDVGRVLNASISKAINTADSQAALDAVRAQIERVRAALGDKIANGLLDQAAAKAEELKNKLDQATGGINSVAEAMTKLGLKSIESMRWAATESVQAFDVIKQAGQQEGESYVAWQRRKEEAARVMLQRLIEANGGVADAAIRARAAAEGLKIESDASGRSTVKSMREAEEATRRVGDAARGAGGGFRALGQQAEDANQKIQKLYDKHRLDKDKDPDRIGKSGDLREAAVMETDVNQEIARRYGEEFIDNDLAKKAFNLRLQLENYQKSYGNVTRSQESLNQQRNIGAELERIEREIENERQGKKAGGTATPERPQAVQPSDKPSSSSSSGSGGGVSYVSNITIPGISAHTPIRYADAQSQRNGEDLLRKLAQAKSSAIR